MTSLLSVSGLEIDIELNHGRLLNAVRNISFSLDRGEKLGLVGESGSGKSLTALAVMRLLHNPFLVRGSIHLDGVDLYSLSAKEIANVRAREMGMIYQDPTSSLNPVYTVGEQITEAIRLTSKISKSTARNRAIDLLQEVGVRGAKERVDNYPHQFSGGMRQRVMIAMAMANDPKILIADEPTTALDVTTQARVMELLARIVEERGLAVILITHDLGVASQFCDRLSVMYGGRIVESSQIENIMSRPNHPYTKALINSVCTMELDVTQPMIAIGGQPPILSNMPSGCSFHTRCQISNRTSCRDSIPELRKIEEDRYVACHLVDQGWQ